MDNRDNSEKEVVDRIEIKINKKLDKIDVYFVGQVCKSNIRR